MTTYVGEFDTNNFLGTIDPITFQESEGSIPSNFKSKKEQDKLI
jgi:hypothetical protein